MFRTTATLARPHPSRTWMTTRAPVVFSVALVVMMPVSALLSRIDAHLGSVVPIVMTLAAAVYGVALSRGMQPVRQRVDLVIDLRGILADGALLVARGEMRDAYLRPATEAIQSRFFSYPAQPMHLEVITARETLVIEGDHDEHTRHILAALGVPARMVAADYIAPTAENGHLARDAAWSRRWMVGTLLLMIAVPIGLILAWTAWSYTHRAPPQVFRGVWSAR